MEAKRPLFLIDALEINPYRSGAFNQDLRVCTRRSAIKVMNNEAKEQPDLLEAILSRPAMYWGNSENHFHSFLAFLPGYKLASAKNMTEDLHCQMEEIIPPDFHRFVTEYYGFEYPYGGRGWQTFIEINSSNGEESIKLFQELRAAYFENKRSAAAPGASHKGGTPPRES